jgi:hypothetical protein
MAVDESEGRTEIRKEQKVWTQKWDKKRDGKYICTTVSLYWGLLGDKVTKRGKTNLKIDFGPV